MNKLPDPIASQKIFDYLIEHILQKSQKNLTCTMMAFSGSGKTAELNYLISNIDNLDFYSKKHLFALLDLEVLVESKETAFREMFSYLLNNFEKHLDKEEKSEIEKILSEEFVDPDDIYKVFHNITNVKDTGITVIIDNSHTIYEGNPKSMELSEIVYTLKRVNLMKISFIFIASKEPGVDSVQYLQRLSELFLENVIYSGEILFDGESADLLLRNLEKKTKYSFEGKFKDKLKDLSLGDPLMMRVIADKAVYDNDFEKNFVETEDVSKIFELIDNHMADDRFSKIVTRLSEDSLNCLAGGYKNPTEFLIKTGLVQNTGSDGEGKSWLPINNLFDYFVKENKGRLHDFLKITHAFIGDTVLKSVLSAKELIVFDFLKSKGGEVAKRDEIAQVMWGDDWENKYSDWAIDQVISRIRKKLEEKGYEKTIKTLKGQGFMLV